jgi:hypothetical protein
MLIVLLCGPPRGASCDIDELSTLSYPILCKGEPNPLRRSADCKQLRVEYRQLSLW